jgi:hypothetical protein
MQEQQMQEHKMQPQQIQQQQRRENALERTRIHVEHAVPLTHSRARRRGGGSRRRVGGRGAVALLAVHLGFGRTAASEIEAPIMFGNLV